MGAGSSPAFRSMSQPYVYAQLERALSSALEHPDAAVRARARQQVQRWRAVVEGTTSGHLQIGSRTPVADTPAWVTLEVVHGGFATGRYLAEGELLEHERVLLAKLPAAQDDQTARERLNHWYLGDAGQAQLRAALQESRYHIEVPEEGALMVVALLLDRGHGHEALVLLDRLQPLMHRLRFYPRLVSRPRPAGACVRRLTVGEVADRLAARKPNPRVEAMNHTLAVWTPLFDRLVALWLDTVDGEPPHIVREPDGRRVVVGGWPCRQIPSDWSARRAQWLADLAAVPAPRRKSRHLQPDSDFMHMLAALERCEHDAAALDGPAVGRIRRALANTLTKLGEPGSARREQLRHVQAEQAARPLHSDLARVLFDRLAACDRAAGLPTLDGLDAPVRAQEHAAIAAGATIPANLLRSLAQALEAPLAELIEREVIGSSEVLAQLLPQITAQVLAAGIDDPVARELFACIYAAFRRRRSLLLLDLAAQVRLDELPWIAALAPLRSRALEQAGAARQTLEDVSVMAFSAFPHTLTPNPLVRELSALAKQATLQLPLVEELAADIFMGTFTEKWAKATQCASTLLDGTLYARYYELPRPGDRRLRDGKSVAQLCELRVGEQVRYGDAAANGCVIEHGQIVTTHNLAVLIDGLGLLPRVRPLAADLAMRAFAWSLARQLPAAEFVHARLKLVKNVAYAWRQAIFWLSLCEADEQARVLGQLGATLSDSPSAWQTRMVPAHAGLRAVFEGGSFTPDGRDRAGGPGRRLLGWTLGRHWLLA